MYSFQEKERRLRQQLFVGGLGLGGLSLLGTLWYKLVEGWSWLDAFYMTAITLSTVGYGETYPLSATSRLFTIGLILAGLIVIAYIVNGLTEAFLEGYFQQRFKLRQERQLIESLRQHYILCGFGRMGRQVAMEFKAENIPFAIVDLNIEQVEAAKQFGYTALMGDATLDETLMGVKIEKAICLVAALGSDAENLYTVLSAKTLNPNLRAIARASTQEAVQKLQRAGADMVVSPYITGGKRLAAAALRPQVMDFVDGIISGADRSFYMEEFLLDPKNCPCVGQTLREARLRSQSGALVLAIRRADGTLIAGPMGETRLMEKDLLICMGTAEQLSQLNRILAPIPTPPPRLPKQK
ncbi:MAG: potassium channel protein [Prochloraceae cyanobacterium]|nr:potassium channel protein [Prochloraceae cyanobacterium]